QDFGWVFDTPTGGRLIHTTDQDWVRATTSPALMANILHALSGVNPCAPFHGVGCPGSGGLAPRLHLTGCPAPGAQLLLAIEDGLGGAPALLLVAAQPAALPLGGGCLLNVMSPALAVGPLPLGGS